MLTVEELAQVIAQWRRPLLDSVLVQRVASWWVEYQLFAHRVVSGDSLLDSTTVLQVMWTEARAYVLARWRQQLFASQLPLEAASLDSVYRAGEYRLIQHVLFQAAERGPTDRRNQALRRAEALREQLRRGLSWTAAQRQNEDLTARQQSGSVGVITRGQTEPEFEGAAFALEPGEISRVVASSFGFHIARRPPLAEVREAFAAAVEPLVAERLDSLHMRELAKRWRLALRPGGLNRARGAVRNPLRYRDSGTTIATFEGGHFTLGDLVRWLEAVPDWMHTSVERGTDERLSQFLDMMMGYELLYREALSHNVTLSAEEFAMLKKKLAERLDELMAALNVYSPGPSDSASVAELERRAAERVDDYLRTLPQDWQRFARVPALLADKLKEQARWAVYPRGIERSVQRAAELQAARDSVSPDRL